jgi:CelD/BcsL family acetyltransferase involved in cellulose biosynthesis
LPARFEDYFSTVLTQNARSALRRQEKALGPGVELHRCESHAELRTGLTSLFDLHGQRWREAGEDGSFARKPLMQRFYEVFAPVALDRGWLRLYTLRVAGRDCAVQFGYAYGGAFLQLQEGFAPDAPPGIGNVLRLRVIRACIEQGLHAYDFLGGFNEHKRRWGAQPRTGCDVFCGRRSLKNALLFAKPIWPTGRFLREAPIRARTPQAPNAASASAAAHAAPREVHAP